MINDSNRDSIDWGPNCDTERGQVKIPYTYARAVREALHAVTTAARPRRA